MNRLQADQYAQKIRAHGQDVHLDYAGKRVGYRLVVRVDGRSAVVLASTDDAEQLVRGLQAQSRKEVPRG